MLVKNEIKMKKLLFIFGTRPEAIKMVPLVREFKLYPDKFNVKVCVTAQHREMLDQVLTFFGVVPDYDLNIMKHNQSLFDITADVIKNLEPVFNNFEPDVVFVQGDTSTSFLGALGAFYKKIKVAHLEAGLRSFDKYAPFPEEVNRKLITHLADYHFPPTSLSKQTLINEGIKDHIYIVGNTVIDALLWAKEIVSKYETNYVEYFKQIDFSKRVILVTGHRRENFGKPFEDISNAIKEISLTHDVEIVYPVHLNPNVQKPVNEILGGLKNVHLIKPIDYPYLIWLMNKSYIVLTDSGGIQEEAPSLGKPVLVMRDVTERTEGVDAGTAVLVGTNKEVILSWMNKLLTNQDEYDKMAKAVNPYGDGTTSKQVVEVFMKHL